MGSQCLGFDRMCVGGFCVPTCLLKIYHVPNGIKVWGVSWPWTRHFDVLINTLTCVKRITKVSAGHFVARLKSSAEG